MNQRSIASCRQPSRESLTVSTHSDRVLNRDGIASSYTFSDSEDIATNLRVGSPARSRRKKLRGKLKTYDGEAVNSSVNEFSSRESSRGWFINLSC